MLDPHTGKTYYVNSATGQTTWELPRAVPPRALPRGWINITDDASGATYYHNASTGATSWTHPGDDVPRVSGSDSGSGSGSGSSSSTEDEGGAGARERRKRSKKAGRTFVRWKFVKRDEISLASALLSEATIGALASSQRATAVTALLPSFLAELYARLFTITNRSGSGHISTIELTTMLRTRAKDTGLNGDATAIFALKTLLATQGGGEDGEHGAIGPAEFASGLTKALLQDPNGHVAQWILLELQDEAARWCSFEHSGQTCFEHNGDGDKTWAVPPILEHMERVASLFGGRAATVAT